MTERDRILSRSRLAIGGLWAVVLADLAAVVTGVGSARHLSTLPSDAIAAELELVPSELFYALAGVAQLAALVVTAVFFIRWFRSAHEALPRLSGEATAYDSRWTLWGFFVPILNLIRPQQLMREIWETTTWVRVEQPQRILGAPVPPDRVNLWWGLLLATGFAGNVVGRAAWKASTVEETLHTTWLTVGTDALDVVAALVAISLVRAVTELQRPLLDSMAPPAGS
jgi:hypothetical protein